MLMNIDSKKQQTQFDVCCFFVHTYACTCIYYSRVFVKNYKGMKIMNPCQLTTSITALANAVASGLSAEETVLLATVLVQLGDTLATIGTQRTICESKET